MARTLTLAQLRSQVRVRGGYENSTDITDTVLDDLINSALPEVWDIITGKWLDYYTTSAAATVTIGTDSTPLPSDFYKLRKVEILQSDGRYRRLLPADLDVAHTFQSVSNKAYRYREALDSLFLMPPAVATETLRIWYIKVAPVLAAALDTFDGINGYEALLVQHALRGCAKRQDLPTGEIDQEISRLTARVRTAADGRDATEAFYLDPFGPLGWGGWGDDEGLW